MERLTTEQIREFNNPLAFSRNRSVRIGAQSPSSASNPVRTTDIEESFRLVTGALSRLETLEENLNTMLELAREARRTQPDSRQQREIYGKLRSLSAGFDQVADSVKFKGQSVFTGETHQLSLGPGSRPLQAETSRLLTYGEGGLNLSEGRPAADVAVRYNTDDLIINSSYTIVGLDLRDATLDPEADPVRELEDGLYKARISYAGENSAVELRTSLGSLIQRVENVDLSGTGSRWVTFDSGLRLEFEMENSFSSFDKYDFESNGPAELSASLEYRRIEQHVVRTDDEAPPPDGVSFAFEPSLSDSGGTIRAGDPRLAPTSPGFQTLASGAYSLVIDYRGENSVIKVQDQLGRLLRYQFDVDLTRDQARIDTGVGFDFAWSNPGFTGDSGSLTIPLDFQLEEPPLESFNFIEYEERIRNAITVIEEQRNDFESFSADIQQRFEEQNQARSGIRPGAGNILANSALSILSRGNGSGSILNTGTTGARLDQFANQLFSTTTALPTQGQFTDSELNALRQSATPSGSFSLPSR